MALDNNANRDQLCVLYADHARFFSFSTNFSRRLKIIPAETLAAAYRLWRRNWAGKGREYTAGALVWQVRKCETAGLGLTPNRLMIAGR